LIACLGFVQNLDDLFFRKSLFHGRVLSFDENTARISKSDWTKFWDKVTVDAFFLTS
jgi:hypothetical protein